MDFKSPNFGKRIIISTIATIILGITIGSMRVIDLGIDPFTSLIIGISNLSQIPFRHIYPLVNASIIVFIFILNKTMIGMGTLINLIIIGPVADYSANFIESIYINQTFLSRIILLVISLIVMAMNVSLYTSTNIGVSAYDSIFITVNKRQPKIPLGLARFITDILSMSVGILGSVTIGIGTIINVLLMGPMVEFFNKTLTRKLLNNII